MTSPLSFQSVNSPSFLDPMQYHYSKEVLLVEQNSLLAKMQLFASHSSPRDQIQTGKIVELNKMQAIRIQDLLLNIENRNKFIYSTQISRIAECETIRFIIEDEYGNACRVSIPGNTDTSRLIMGVKLAFCNPNYRKSFDGKYSLIVNIISDIYLMGEFPSLNAPRLSSLTSTLFPTSTPSPVSFFSFEGREISPTQSTLPTSSLKKADISRSTIQFGGPYHSLSGEAKLIGSEQQQQQQQQQQQPLEEEVQSCIDLPQSPEIGHEDADTLNSTGVKLFKEGRYLEAMMKYNSAIQVRDVSEYYSNRGLCYFNMEYFEIALSDFQKAFSTTPNSVRYQYWIALTWAKIGSHKMSLDVLTKIKSIPIHLVGTVNSLKRKEKILVENIGGKFDFDILRQNVIDSKDNEIADYIGPIRIQKTTDKGRGIFTTRKVLKGENLCVVKAIEFSQTPFTFPDCLECKRNIFRQSLGQYRLHFNLMEKASKSKLTTVRLISLCDRSINKVNINLYSGHGSEFTSNYDTTKYPLHKLESLASENLSIDFDMSILNIEYGTNIRLPMTQYCCGFWLLPSFINHSCIPNVVKLFTGDICIVRAITEIAEGDEILCSYVPLDTFPTVECREEFLKFQCNCKLCKFEKNPDFLHTISQIISLNNYLDTFVSPLVCLMRHRHQKQPIMKQTFSRDKWLEIRDKFLNFAKILPLAKTSQHIYVPFLNGILCLLRASFSPQDALDLVLEVERYFSHFEPATYVIFWNSSYKLLKEVDKLRHPHYKHFETKCYEILELFT